MACTNSIGMQFVRIEPGTFLMGSPPDEPERDSGETQHRVRVSKPFWLGVHGVTQAQWRAVMGTTPSYFEGDDLPVESVSWEDAVEFCRKLSEIDGKRYRLPTEAEWEYACRAGTTTPYGGSGKLDEMGWYHRNEYTRPHSVGRKKPNAWGVYDMHGNVGEWCSDWYGDYPSGEAGDPKGPDQGMFRVLRGGSWLHSPEGCRSANRAMNAPGYRASLYGFRVALHLP